MSAQTEPPAQAPLPWRTRAWESGKSWAWTLLWAALIWMTLQSLRGGAALDQKQLPEFSVADTAGKLAQRSDLAGKVTVLYFWATWCSACKLTSPSVASFAESHPDVPVLAVAADEPEDLRRYLAETPRPFRTAVATRKMLNDFGVHAFPTTLVVDASGKVAWSRVGVLLPVELGLHVP